MHETKSPFRSVPLTGVIFVSTKAQERGYNASNSHWCNLGQGQPETGDLPFAPPRLTSIDITPDAYDYAPVGGLPELRSAVADYYNRTYRKGKKSQYSAENVAISAGGRLAVARAAAILGPVHVGHFLPDYTAYEELLDIFRVFTPIPILRDPSNDYKISLDTLEQEIVGRGLSALLFSNPCNPTGTTLMGVELGAWVSLANRLKVAMVVDEFYSHYIWNTEQTSVSAAEFIEDIEKENILIIDGLTKNWRYPGLRISWTLGPKKVIDTLTSAGSFLDGGASRPTQEAAVPLLEDSYVKAENKAIRLAFQKKRDFLLEQLQAMGIRVQTPPQGGFYVWGSLEALPKTLQTDMDFFNEALKHEVITVPGHFFDINPGGKRRSSVSRFSKHMRFSFGPSMEVLQTACQRLSNMIQEHRT